MEVDSLAATEGIKELFAIGFELALVVGVDEKLLPFKDVGCVVCLGIVCDEPVNESEGEGGCAE